MVGAGGELGVADIGGLARAGWRQAGERGDQGQAPSNRARRIGGASAGRDGGLAAIVVEAALDLAAEPAGLDVLHQQRAGAVLAVGQALVEHLHDRQAGVEADEVGELQRPHRVVGAELHRVVDALDRADALVERVDRLVDHRQQDAVDDEGREVLGGDRGLAQLLGQAA